MDDGGYTIELRTNVCSTASVNLGTARKDDPRDGVFQRSIAVHPVLNPLVSADDCDE